MSKALSLIDQLRDVCPSVVFSLTTERDFHLIWDGDGPKPKNRFPFTVTVSGSFIAHGNFISASNSLGGCYYRNDEKIGDVSGYLPDMVSEVLLALHHRIEATKPLEKELEAAIDFVLAVRLARNSTQGGSQMSSSPDTIPAPYANKEALSDAYRQGWNHGHGIACHTVPTIGQRIDRSVDYVGYGKEVTAENIREYHELLCHASADNAKQYSPFESLASAFNAADEDDEPCTAIFNRFLVEMTWSQAQSGHHQGQCYEDVSALAPQIERSDDCTPLALALELKEYGAWSAEELADDAANWLRIVWTACGNIREEHTSAEELWEAFEQGTSDAISADLAEYSDSDYGIPSYGNPPDGFRDYLLPECWASYLINGDASGLEDAEIAACDAWFDSYAGKLLSCADCSDEPEFRTHNDAGTLAGDCLWFRFPIKGFRFPGK